MQMYKLTGVHLPAFEYLASQGRIVFLYDSFDEMAQTLTRPVMRENFRQLVEGIGNSRAIMSSRPTYFEGRAERLLVVEGPGLARIHRQDELEHERQRTVSSYLQKQVASHQYARLNDLTIQQRRSLFAKVLKGKPESRTQLDSLFTRFQELETIAQRAVIARLLTTVAETIASSKEMMTPDGYPLLPDDLESLNQAKIFEVVVNNLLQRDTGIGLLSAGDRLHFLRSFALFLQQPSRDFFASPEDVRGLVQSLFRKRLEATDQPHQELENLYRACRRHSGLTTESQFRDTSGQLDTPVDEQDMDSRVGFSHNSLREYLVADAIAEFSLKGQYTEELPFVVVTEAVGEFVHGISEFRKELIGKLAAEYRNARTSRLRESLFRVVYWITRRNSNLIHLLGSPATLDGLDLSSLWFKGLSFQQAQILNSIVDETDFRGGDLRNASFDGSIVRGALFDDANLDGADFTRAEILSIHVYDEFDSATTGILEGKQARQWLFSHGARVWPTDDLNPLLGKQWYEAAREVCKTLTKQFAGTRKLSGLWKGTDKRYRPMAKEFAEHLLRRGVLERAVKSAYSKDWVVKVTKEGRKVLSDFIDEGKTPDVLKEFFEKHSELGMR